MFADTDEKRAIAETEMKKCELNNAHLIQRGRMYIVAIHFSDGHQDRRTKDWKLQPCACVRFEPKSIATLERSKLRLTSMSGFGM